MKSCKRIGRGLPPKNGLEERVPPTKHEVDAALAVLEQAGFDVIDMSRAVEFHKKRTKVYRLSINSASKGDTEAAERLIKWFMQDLRFPAPWLSSELCEYFTGVLGRIVESGDDPSLALNLKCNHRPPEKAVAVKRSRAYWTYQGFRENHGDKEAVSKTAERMSCDERTVRRYLKIYSEHLDLLCETRDSDHTSNPKGLVVIT